MKRPQRLTSKKLTFESLEFRNLLSADSVVTFNEVMYNPASGNQTLEWVELHNQTSIDVDLSDWKISDAVEFQFAAGTTIVAGGYLVVAADATALQAATGYSEAVGSYTGSLSNGGESIALLDRNDRLMDQLDYDDEGDWPVAPDGSGATLAKRDPHFATASFNSWQASSTVGGTPGVANASSLDGTLVTTTLIADGSAAKTFVPIDDSLGASWTGGGEPFNDSSWITGTTAVGFDTEATYDSLIGLDLETAMQGVNAGAYIRVPFDVNDPNAISELTLDARYDDGFVAYLNGVEIARRNAPTVI
ncbi:MAG: lamin tail domain-containing protein, partial [Bythopirellula sp.]